MENLYGLMTILGPVLLGAVLLWAIFNNRRTPREERRTEEATRELYAAQDRDDKLGQ